MADYAIGIDLGGTNLRAALVQDNGEVFEYLKAPTPIQEGPQAIAEKMAELVFEIQKKHPTPHLLGIGIGSPGPLSRQQKTIFESPNLPGINGFPLGGHLELLTKTHVFLDNDAKCAAYGEKKFGVAKDAQNFILMTLGTGIGGGVFVDGKMVYGKSDNACEIGHMTLYPGGDLCPCGNQGCFERYFSAKAIERRLIDEVGLQKSCREIFEAAENGDGKDTWAAPFLRKVSKDIGIAVASLVNLFDPELVVLGGGAMTSGGGPVCQWVEEEIADRCFKTNQRGLKVAASALGGRAGVLGAASLVFTTY